MNTSINTIFTIGHSTHSAESFLALLQQHDVQALVDVRSSPFSRFNPQFNRQTLEQLLRVVGIRYVFLGKELGARSEEPSCYINGRVQYSKLADTQLFQSGIVRVVQGAEHYRVALMCAEKEPLECHRTLLVSKALVAKGLSVLHIHSDGHLESHDAAMDRLLELTGLPKEDLFSTRDELVAEALARQEKQIAYVDETHSSAMIGDEQQ